MNNSSVKVLSGDGQNCLAVDGNSYIVDKYFKYKELACRGSSRLCIDESFLYDLQDLRIKFNYPMVVSSCCRGIEHNNNVGGHPRSLHLMFNPYHPTRGTEAIDINVNGYTIPLINKLLDIAVSMDYSLGMGYKLDKVSGTCIGFLHLDRRTRVLGLPRTDFFY